jgi:cobalt/nickel transport system permease protein
MPVAAFVAGLLSTVVTALVVTAELYISGTSPLAITASLMTGWHLLIGAAEGLITATTISYLAKVRPDLIKSNTGLDGRVMGAFAGVAAVIALLLSPFASTLPDGLERVAIDTGFFYKGTGLFAALIPDYSVPGLKNEWLATGLAGVIGVLLTVTIAFGVASITKRRSARAVGRGNS